jgi:hypothetical protein
MSRWHSLWLLVIKRSVLIVDSVRGFRLLKLCLSVHDCNTHTSTSAWSLAFLHTQAGSVSSQVDWATAVLRHVCYECLSASHPLIAHGIRTAHLGSLPTAEVSADACATPSCTQHASSGSSSCRSLILLSTHTQKPCVTERTQTKE